MPRKDRYRPWLDACVAYLKESGEQRSVHWLLDNIDAKAPRTGNYKRYVAPAKNRVNSQWRPPNINSAVNHLRREKRLSRGYIGETTNLSSGTNYPIQSWWYDYEE